MGPKSKKSLSADFGTFLTEKSIWKQARQKYDIIYILNYTKFRFPLKG